jgi:hypothetical protein
MASPSLFRIACLALPLVHLFSAAFHVYCGAMNADEGFYAIAARSVMEGDLPYRDFGYTQLPLVPYINGPVLSVIGYGLFEQRWLNGLWGVLALGFLLHWVGRRASWPVALAAVASFTLSPAWMHYIHLGKTYAVTSLVVAAAAWVFVTRPGGWRKQCLLGVLGVIGVGSRLPSAPFFAVLWLAAFWHDGPPRGRTLWAGLLGVGLPTLALFGPFYLLAPAASHFWMFDFHALSVPFRTWPTEPEHVAGAAPVWWAALAILLVAIAVRRQLPVSRDSVVVVAAIAALLPNLLPRGVYVEYAIPFLVPLAGGVAVELHRLAITWSTRGKLALVTALAAAHLAVIPVFALASGRASDLASWNAWLPANIPPYELDLRTRLTRAVGLVRQLVPPNQPLLGPNIILAAETGRAVPRAARMGPFSTTAEYDAATARRLNLLTYPEIHAWLADPQVTLLAFFTTPRVNYAWSVPSFKLQPREEAEQWLGVLRRDFVIVQQDPNFLLVARPGALPR